MLQLNKVVKKYHTQLVLDIPCLELGSGLYWLKGANGSGKTTLLKMVVGIIPFEGDISWQHTSLSRQPVTYRQQVSWAEAEPLYPPFLTGMNLIKLYSAIRKAPAAQAQELIAALDMQAYVKQEIGAYSAGMTKKLSLVLSLLGNTSLIVLDEPLITLDAASVQVLCSYIVHRHQQQGTTFLMSSHQEPESRATLPVTTLTVQNHHIVTL